MKNSVGVLFAALINVTPVCLWAMGEPPILDLSYYEPHRLVEQAREAASYNDISQAAARIALSRIWTKMDAACLCDDLLNLDGLPMQTYRNSPEFQQKTGPILDQHDHNAINIPADIFKKMFPGQVRVAARALSSNELPLPYWILEHKRVRLNMLSEDAYKYTSSRTYFVSQKEWFARRAAVIREYYSDKTLFPGGAPEEILPPKPRSACFKLSDCVLQ